MSMTVRIKLKEKYFVGKMQSGGYAPRTNQGGSNNRSLGAELFQEWAKKEPGKSQHKTEKERQASMKKRVKIFRGQGRGTGWKWASEEKEGK